MDSPDGGAAWKHGLGRIESRDFVTWSMPQWVLGPDEHDNPEYEFHTSPVFLHNNCYINLNQILNRRAEGAIEIELMRSRDSLRWERPFRDQPFLARSESGQFDSHSIFTNSTPVVLADEIRFYYGAYNQSPIGGVKSEPGERSGVGVASIPRSLLRHPTGGEKCSSHAEETAGAHRPSDAQTARPERLPRDHTQRRCDWRCGASRIAHRRRLPITWLLEGGRDPH